jgi:hypothetical protein
LPRSNDELSERVLWALRALGGEATLGDLVVVTGLSRAETEGAIERLIARGQGHARVFDRGDLTYHLAADADRKDGEPRLGRVGLLRPRGAAALALARRAIFDRKTLRLIRAREGVISLAELVEQTGLALRDAQREMLRLAESWGGEPHVGLDGYVVYAFPELMSSVHGSFVTREPRPAWVRRDDPMDHARSRDRRARLGIVATAAGALTIACVPLLVGASVAGFGVIVAVATGCTLLATGAGTVLQHHQRFRFRQRDTLRRYALGHVVETALAGKGVVSLERTLRFIKGRAGRQPVSRSTVEAALRELAADFDAPITTEGGDLFFGFRNVKRQFLASHLLRRQLALGRKVSGEAFFDTADSPGVASARELQAFDRELGLGPPPPPATPPPD